MCREQNTSVLSLLLAFFSTVTSSGYSIEGRERQYATEGPRPVIQPEDQYACIGDTVSFRCEGHFGYGDSTTRFVNWFGDLVAPKYGAIPVRDLTQDPRYTVEQYERSDGTVLGANLTIRDLKESDFNKNLHCFMVSAQIVNPSRQFTVQVRQC